MEIMHVFHLTGVLVVQIQQREYLRAARLQIQFRSFFLSRFFVAFFFRSLLESLEQHFLRKSALLFETPATLVEERRHLYCLWVLTEVSRCDTAG